jgi:hypothetical protein
MLDKETPAGNIHLAGFHADHCFAPRIASLPRADFVFHPAAGHPDIDVDRAPCFDEIR